MNCEQCGTKLLIKEKYCPKCGTKANKINIGQETVILILGLICIHSIIISIVGIVLKFYEQIGNTGLIISLIYLVLGFFILLVLSNFTVNAKA